MTGSVRKRLPDFIIIGAMKAGTTSLFAYLNRHPKLTGSSEKEPGFFTDREWHHGVDWYQRLFPETDDLIFEASTNYTKYPHFGNVPRRMHDLLPEVKLIYIVRHPVNRLISQLHHLIVRRQLENRVAYNTRSFWEERGAAMINVSRYHLQYSQYSMYYPPEQIHVLRFEDLVANPPAELNRILGFLGLDDQYFDDKTDYRIHNELTTRARVRFRKLHAKLRGVAKRKNMPSLYRFLETPIPRPVLEAGLQRWIWDQLSDDLEAFQTDLTRNLAYHAPV